MSSEIRKGDYVNYRFALGAPITHFRRRVLCEPWPLAPHERMLVKVDGLSGGIDVAHLQKVTEYPAGFDQLLALVIAEDACDQSLADGEAATQYTAQFQKEQLIELTRLMDEAEARGDKVSVAAARKCLGLEKRPVHGGTFPPPEEVDEAQAVRSPWIRADPDESLALPDQPAVGVGASSMEGARELAEREPGPCTVDQETMETAGGESVERARERIRFGVISEAEGEVTPAAGQVRMVGVDGKVVWVDPPPDPVLAQLAAAEERIVRKVLSRQRAEERERSMTRFRQAVRHATAAVGELALAIQAVEEADLEQRVELREKLREEKEAADGGSE